MFLSLRFGVGYGNVEKLRVKINDPVDGASYLLPDELYKLDLVVGDVVISSTTSEITWVDEKITINPSAENRALLPSKGACVLQAYKTVSSDPELLACGSVSVAVCV